MNKTKPREWWIHRITWSDGRTESSSLRQGAPGQPCFAAISQYIARKSDPGATVEHVVVARIEAIT